MKMLLNGRPTDARSGKTFPVRNSASGEVVDTVPQAGPDDVREAIEIAKRGRRIMAALAAYRRSEILSNTASLIAARFDDLVQLLTAENGKTVRQCRAEMTTTQRLQSSVFTKNINDAIRLAHQLEVGGVVINGSGAFRPGNVPFGGAKQSGIGRESIVDTVQEMTEGKTIVINQALAI